MLDLFDTNLGNFVHGNKVLTLGNHENRLYRQYSENPQLEDAFGHDPFGFEGHDYYVFDYQDIVEINGVRFSHNFINPKSLIGSVQGGSADVRVKNIGFPHVAGHQHGPLLYKQEFLGDGSPMSCLIIGACHTENHGYWGNGREVYKGAAILHDVRGGSYDLEARQIDNLIKRYV